MESIYITPTEYQDDPAKIADLIFSNSLLAKKSQTAVFYGNISSLDAVMKEYINRPTQLKMEIETLYKTLFERYFDSCDVNIELQQDSKVGNALTMIIHITYTNNNVVRQLAETVLYMNGKTRKLTERING
ncbi:hypothetical protein DQR70_05830 [Salmonella enterica subsp. enterica serovar Oslo]|nr:hypothetical protein [Salmonella enterica subsp. enterica serovar Oslo]EEX4841277.1 hypothetical protein [Escherichia coli]ELF5188680.1 hypothetical protein [Salmonella enterica]